MQLSVRDLLTPVLTTLAQVPPWVFVILGVLLILLFWLPRKRSPKYDGKQYLFTKTEWAFFQVLHAAVADRYLVMGKPRIADVLFVRKGQTRSDWARAFSQISSKHVDYLIVDPKGGRIVAAIELDDPSHQRQDRQARDVFVNQAFKDAGIPLLRYPTAKTYDRAAITRDIDQAAIERLGRAL